MAGFFAYETMKRFIAVILCALLIFSTGCGDIRSGEASEAVPHDVVVQVCRELDGHGVVMSDLGVDDAYIRAGEIFGSLDGLVGWALFVPYDQSLRGVTMQDELPVDFQVVCLPDTGLSDSDLSTFAQVVVDKSGCCEFGVLLTADGSYGDRYAAKLGQRISDGGCVVRQGRFVVYSTHDDREVNEVVRRLYCVD